MSLATPRKGYKSVPWLFGKEIEIPEEWEVNEIQNHVEVTTGSKNTQDRVQNGKYPFYVRSQKIERIDSFSFDEESVLTAGDGVGTGKVFHYVNFIMLLILLEVKGTLQEYHNRNIHH